VHAVPALGASLGQPPEGTKHVHLGPAKVPQLQSVPSGYEHSWLAEVEQSEPSAGGEDGHAAVEGHGPNAPFAFPHRPSAQAKA
jgi:hypothetical protein